MAGQTKDTFTIATIGLIFNTFDLITQFLFSYIYTIRTILNFKIAQRLVKEVTDILRKTKIASVLNGLIAVAVLLGIMLVVVRDESSSDPNIKSQIRENLTLVLICIVVKMIDSYFYMVFSCFNYLKLSSLMQLASLFGTTSLAYFLAIRSRMGLSGILLAMVLDGLARAFLIQGCWYWSLNMPKEICSVDFK